MWTTPCETEIMSFPPGSQAPWGSPLAFPFLQACLPALPRKPGDKEPLPKQPTRPGGWAERGHSRLWLGNSDPRHQVEPAASVMFSFPPKAPAAGLRREYQVLARAAAAASHYFQWQWKSIEGSPGRWCKMLWWV